MSANLKAVWKRVKSNRGGVGVDGLSIAETAEYLKAEWPRIRASLLGGSYRPKPGCAGERVLVGLKGLYEGFHLKVSDAETAVAPSSRRKFLGYAF